MSKETSKLLLLNSNAIMWSKRRRSLWGVFIHLMNAWMKF